MVRKKAWFRSPNLSRGPALVEHELRSHASTQNMLADFISADGFEPRSPRPDEPNFGLLRAEAHRTCIVEVKSIREENEERQLRLALGQVLRYRLELEGGDVGVHAIVCTSKKSTDETEAQLYSQLDACLAWRGAFERVL